MPDERITCKSKSSGSTLTVYIIEDYYPEGESGYLFDHNQNVLPAREFHRNYEVIQS